MSTADALARKLSALSASEMVDALGARKLRGALRKALSLPFFAASRPLGRTLSRFDADVPRLGLPLAARGALERFGVTLRVAGAPSASGPLLVLANHPGAYDALALMAALARADLLILAADRSFLRSLPQLSEHLLFVGERAPARASALRRALQHLQRGGALLHFPAGEIEPDPQFSPRGTVLLKAWQPGALPLVKATARAAGVVQVAGASGVHSARAKRLLITRLAEKRGITTLAPLVQMVSGLRDVAARVALGPALDAAQLALLADAALEASLRDALTALLGSA